MAAADVPLLFTLSRRDGRRRGADGDGRDRSAGTESGRAAAAAAAAAASAAAAAAEAAHRRIRWRPSLPRAPSSSRRQSVR